MQQAIDLAKRAYGRTSPNPMVGAVVVKNGEVVGEGWHHKAGEAHAEPNAIADAGNLCAGADIYVTLEPCCTFGRTPPCTESIKSAGIKRVFIGCLDPNPDHAGKAVKILEDAGISVEYGILEEACCELNESFFYWITTGKPMVYLKMAMTLDGKIATKSGQSQWITGPVAREYVQELRQLCDAIMVGGETVRQDNPSLTVRSPEKWPCQPQPVVFTRSTDFDRTLKIFHNHEPIFFSPETDEEWEHFLIDLGKRGITNLLVEGGGELAAEVISRKVADKVFFIIAPKILGGKESRPVVAGKSPVMLAEAIDLQRVKSQSLGNDFLISGYLK